jgi:phosphate starvation-inducible PhoH-like protein
MSRSKRQQKEARWSKGVEVSNEELPVERVVKRNAEPLVAKTDNQKRYINAIKNFELVFGTGPAGTGKTYIACAIAAEMLESKLIEQIILTRPAVEAGEEFGFIPGTLNEKYEPYLTPVRSVFEERLGKSYFEYLLKIGKIKPVPLAFMRGMTFNDAFVILDEAQNTTTKQMKMFLTRIGMNCKTVIDGDAEQVDISTASGLTDSIARIGYIPSVKVVEFGENDIVRSGLVAEVIRAYRRPIIS